MVGWSRHMLYSGFNILPRSVFRSADFNGRSDNLDVIRLDSLHSVALMNSKYFDSENDDTVCYREGVARSLVGDGFSKLFHGHWIAHINNGICSVSWDGIRRDTIKLVLHKSFHDQTMADVKLQIETTGFFEDHFSRELALMVPDIARKYFSPSENIGLEEVAIDRVTKSLRTYGFPIFGISSIDKLIDYKNDARVLGNSKGPISNYASKLLEIASKYSEQELTITKPL